MKCIKDKCRYCKEHDFYSSFYNCTLLNKSFKKDNNIDCLLRDIIQDMEDNLNELKEYYNQIIDLSEL